MSNIKGYIQSFLNKSGGSVLFSSIISRGLSFLGSLIALKLIDNKELGIVLFAFSIIQFIIPFGGLGLYQSLIRYGALLEDKAQKEQLFLYVLKKGIIVSFFIIIATIGVGFFIPFEFKGTYFYFSILSLSILTTFIFEVVKIQFRLQHRNNLFAKADFWHSIILLILIFLGSYFFQSTGYALALLSTPLIASLLFIKKLDIKIKSIEKLSIVNFGFWKYGFFGGLTSVVTQLLFLIDIVLVGYLLNDPEKVTYYRYLSIIPFSLLFLPRAFIATDFVYFTERIHERNYIKGYMKNYMSFFFAISALMLAISYFFKDYILLIFGEDYVPYSNTFFILMVGISGIYIFRGLYGNLLCSIGKIQLNYYIILVAIIINIISNYYLIPLYGIQGAAITSAILMWFTGFLSWLSFLYFYKKFSLNE